MELLKVLRRSDLHLDSFAFTMETGFKGNSTGSKDLKRDKLGKVFTTVYMGARAKAVVVSGSGEMISDSRNTLR